MNASRRRARLAPVLGARARVFALAILRVRRDLPDGPRSLFIHGRDKEVELIVDRLLDAGGEQAEIVGQGAVREVGGA